MSISYVAAGTVAAGTTSAATPYPAGIQAGDLLLLATVGKYSAWTSNPPSGFTFLYERIAGSGGTGVDIGNVRTTVWYRIATGSETGSVSVTKATETGTAILARMFLYRRTAGYGWNLIGDSGQSTTGAATWNAVGSNNQEFHPGDWCVVVSGVNTDGATFTSQALTTTGITWGTVNERQDSGTSNGHDLALMVVDAQVSSGTSSSATTITATATAATTPDGTSIIIRVLESAGVTAAQGNYTLSGPEAGLVYGKRLTAETGTHSLTLQNVTHIAGIASSRAWASGVWKLGSWTGTAWHDIAFLTADYGTYTLSGKDAGLLRGLKSAADQGSYTLSGQDVTFKRGIAASFPYIPYTLSGQVAGSSRTYSMAADYGSVAVTMKNVIHYKGASVGQAWATGSWKSDAWGGTVWADNTLAPGAYRLSAATGRYTAGPAGGGTSWFGDAWSGWSEGSWATGLSVTNLLYKRTMSAGTGYYTYTGDDALRDILLQTVPSVPQALYTLSGQAATFRKGYSLSAETGYHFVNGISANLYRGRRLTAQFGGYLTAGQDVNFVQGIGELLYTGYFTVSGQDATFRLTRNVTAEQGSYALNGQIVNLIYGDMIVADVGSYSLTGQSATLTKGRTLTAETGYYHIGGQLETPPASKKIEGGTTKKSKPRKTLVEIDGQEFVVESPEQAQALVDAATELAQITAKEQAQALVEKRRETAEKSRKPLDIRPVSLVAPKVISSDDALEKALQSVVEAAYRRAEIDAEISLNLAKQALQEEEDALVLLLID